MQSQVVRRRPWQSLCWHMRRSSAARMTSPSSQSPSPLPPQAPVAATAMAHEAMNLLHEAGQLGSSFVVCTGLAVFYRSAAGRFVQLYIYQHLLPFSECESATIIFLPAVQAGCCCDVWDYSTGMAARTPRHCFVSAESLFGKCSCECIHMCHAQCIASQCAIWSPSVTTTKTRAAYLEDFRLEVLGFPRQYI